MVIDNVDSPETSQENKQSFYKTQVYTRLKTRTPMPVSAAPRRGATPKPLHVTFQSTLESYLVIAVTSLPSPPHDMPDTEGWTAWAPPPLKGCWCQDLRIGNKGQECADRMKNGCDLMNTKATSAKQNVRTNPSKAPIQSSPKGECFLKNL